MDLEIENILTEYIKERGIVKMIIKKRNELGEYSLFIEKMLNDINDSLIYYHKYLVDTDIYYMDGDYILYIFKLIDNIFLKLFNNKTTYYQNKYSEITNQNEINGHKMINLYINGYYQFLLFKQEFILKKYTYDNNYLDNLYENLNCIKYYIRFV